MTEIKNPWPGPLPYQKDSGYPFCGRDSESEELIELIRENVFVTLYGKSGVGKTSIINMGVIQKLTDNYKCIRIELEGIEELYAKRIINEVVTTLETKQKQFEERSDNVKSGEYLWEQLFQIKPNNSNEQFIIILDQFERALRGDNKDKAATLLTQLFYMVREVSYFHVDFYCHFVISIREDDLYLLEDCIDENYLYDLKQCRYRLRSLTPDGAREVVIKPGKNIFNEREIDNIADKIVEEVKKESGGEINSMILSLLCSRIYDENFSKYLEKDEKIPIEAVEKTETKAILEKYFNEAISSFTDEEKEYIGKFVDDYNRRISIPKSKFKFPQIIDKQIHPILHENGNYYELIHDSFCKILERRKEQQELEKIKLLRAKELEERYRLLIIESLYVADKVNMLVDQGESYKAQLLALEVIPTDLECHNRPFVKEAADAFRKAVECDTAKIHTDFFVESVAFDLEKSSIIAVGDNKLCSWNIYNGKKIYTHRVNKHSVSAFSQDGRMIGMAEGQLVQFYKLPNYILVKDKFNFKGEAEKIVFSADSSSVAIMSKIWGINSPVVIITTYNFITRETKMLGKYDNNEEEIGLSPNFNYITKKSNTKVSLLKIHKNKIIDFVQSHPIKQYVINTEETYIALETTDSILLVNIQTGEQLIIAAISESQDVGPMIFMEGKKQFVVFLRSEGIVFDYGKKIRKYFKKDNISNYGVFDKSASYISYVYYNKIVVKKALLNIDFSKKTICELTDPWEKFVVSINQKVFACLRKSREVVIKEIDTEKELFAIDKAYNVTSVSFSTGGDYLLTVSVDGILNIWDTQNGVLLPQYNNIEENVYLASYSLDNKRIVSISKEGIIKIWDITSGITIENTGINDTIDNLVSIQLSKDNNLILLVYNSKINIWNVEQKHKNVWHLEDINYAIISPDNKYVIVNYSKYGLIIVRSVNSERIIDELTIDTNRPEAIAKAMLFDDNNNLIVYTVYKTLSYKLLPYLIKDVSERFENVRLSGKEREEYFLSKKTHKYLFDHVFFKSRHNSEEI